MSRVRRCFRRPQGYRNPIYEAGYDTAASAVCGHVLVYLATPRCGSTLLGLLARQTGVLGVPAEYLAEVNRRLIAERLRLPADVDINSYVAALRRIRTTANGVFGIKVQLAEADRWFADDADMLRQLGATALVHVKRRDVLDQAISWAIAESSNAWSEMEGYRMPSRVDLAYSRAAIERYLEVIENGSARWHALCAVAGLPNCELYYEDIIADCRTAMEKIRALLPGIGAGAAPTLEQVELRKQGGAMNADWRRRYLAGDT